MTDGKSRRELQKVRFEWGELERDAALKAQFHEHGGWAYLMCKWFERQFRAQRERVEGLQRDEDAND